MTQVEEIKRYDVEVVFIDTKKKEYSITIPFLYDSITCEHLAVVVDVAKKALRYISGFTRIGFDNQIRFYKLKVITA